MSEEQTECSSCHGLGRNIWTKEPCIHCGGELGRIRQRLLDLKLFLLQQRLAEQSYVVSSAFDAIDSLTSELQAVKAASKAFKERVSQDSEWIQKAWLSPYEKHGWKRKIESLEAEVASLREAIKLAGFSVMQTSGQWSIHDVSQLAEREQERTLEVINQNVELEAENTRLRELLENYQNDKKGN